jgi:hypothetical protein
MKYTLWILLLFVSASVFGQSSMNLSVPTSPQSYQSDRIRTGDVDCSNAIGSSTNFEFGVMGIVDQDDPFANSLVADPTTPFNTQRTTDVAVYARITIPIGAPKERINCNTLYKLELEKKRLELAKLKAEVAQLRRLQFEN